MFQFTRFASASYVFRCRCPCGRVSPFRNLRINAYLPAPRSLSQAFTSFVAYHRQGIHHMLLFTWPYNFDFFHKNSKSIKELFKYQIRLTFSIWYALCRNVNVLSWYHMNMQHRFENDSSLLEFKQSLNSFWRNQNCHQRHGCTCAHFLWQRWFRLYELLKNSLLISIRNQQQRSLLRSRFGVEVG